MLNVYKIGNYQALNWVQLFLSFQRVVIKQCSEAVTRMWSVKRVSACNFIRKETPVQVFTCEFNKILENTCFTEHLRALASNMSFYFSIQISVTFGIVVLITEFTLKPKVQSHQKIGSLNDSKLATSVTNFGIHQNICCNL